MKAIKTIMIVDNEPAVLEHVKSCLEQDEFDIITAPNSREAIQRLEEDTEEHIDLILVNTRMPGSDKTALFSINPRIKVEEMETDTFLQKPFTREQLLDFIKNKLR